MMSTIESSLLSFIQTHRIVFWYDAKKDLRAEYDALTLPNVTKLELANNEFAIKHRLLRAFAFESAWKSMKGS